MSPKAKTKRLEEYSQSSLLDFCTKGRDPYSHTIELYDAVPKYVWEGNRNRIEGKFFDAIEREFFHRGVQYRVVLTPAKIKGGDGVYRDHFPSQREELVEDALRKLASDGKGVYLDEYASVVFTLYELQQELQRMGHGYNLNEIKEALLICSGTGLVVTSEDGSEVVSSHFFETLGLQSRDETGTGHGTRCFVRFNLLVTQSIRHKTFRLINYDKCMSYRRILSRWFHKRMAHVYKQASTFDSYSIKLSTVIRDSGIQVSRLRKALEKVVEACEELQAEEILFQYSIEKIMDPKRANKMIDAKIILIPSQSFVRESVKANAMTPNRGLFHSFKQSKSNE